MINQVALTGRVTRDARMVEIQDNRHFTGFTVAVQARKSRDGIERTDFIDCQIWNERAEKLTPYLTQGLLIGVTGRIHSYHITDKDGNIKYYTVVSAENLTFLESSNRRAQRTESRQTKPSVNSSAAPDPFASPDAFAKTGAKADISDDDLPF